MRPARKLTAFALALAAMFGAGAALGAVAGPIDVGGAPAPADHAETPTTSGPGFGDHGDH